MVKLTSEEKIVLDSLQDCRFRVINDRSLLGVINGLLKKNYIVARTTGDGRIYYKLNMSVTVVR